MRWTSASEIAFHAASCIGLDTAMRGLLDKTLTEHSFCPLVLGVKLSKFISAENRVQACNRSDRHSRYRIWRVENKMQNRGNIILTS
jgi:hypothetical protein